MHQNNRLVEGQYSSQKRQLQGQNQQQNGPYVQLQGGHYPQQQGEFEQQQQTQFQPQNQGQFLSQQEQNHLPVNTAASVAIFQPGDGVQKLPVQILQQIDQLAQAWNISRLFKERIPNMYGKEFVFLFDDSGSMRNTDAGCQGSRWIELKKFAAYCIAFSSAFDQDGVDVYFMNRPKVANVKSMAQLDAVFQAEPTDYSLTPLTSCLNSIVKEQAHKFRKGNCVLVICTDGEPRSADNLDSIEMFREALLKRHLSIGLASAKSIPINIVCLTGDEKLIEYLDELEKVPDIFLDVTEVYEAELEELQEALGKDFSFGKGDYVMKCLLGSTDSWIGKLEEPQLLSQAEIAYHKTGILPQQGSILKPPLVPVKSFATHGSAQLYPSPGNQQFSQQYAPQGNSQYPAPVYQQYASQTNQQYLIQGNLQYPPRGCQQYPPQGSQQYPPPGSQQYPPQCNQQYSQQGNQQYYSQSNQQYLPESNQQFCQQGNQQYSPQGNQQYLPQGNQHYCLQGNQLYSPPGYLQNPSQGNLQYAPQGNQQYLPSVSGHLSSPNTNANTAKSPSTNPGYPAAPRN